MNNWYAKNNKVSPEQYRSARDGLRLIKHHITSKILEFNNNCKLPKEALGGKMIHNKQDRESKNLEVLIHGMDNPKHADLSCPNVKWMGEDLNHCPGIGEWKCMLQEYRYASDQYGLDSKDYHPCKDSDHKKCEIYMKHGGEKNGQS